MSTESENPKSEPPRGSKRDGASHRKRRWWSRLRFPGILSRAADWLYDFWFPFSESSHGYHGYSYGHYGRSRQNRVKWLWRRFRRLVRRSIAASAVRALKVRWYYWWHPVSHDRGQTYSSELGGTRQHRLVRDWRRLKRIVEHSFLWRRYKILADRFYDWWYPSSKNPAHIMAMVMATAMVMGAVVVAGWNWPGTASNAGRVSPGLATNAEPWPAAFMTGISRW